LIAIRIFVVDKSGFIFEHYLVTIYMLTMKYKRRKYNKILTNIFIGHLKRYIFVFWLLDVFTIKKIVCFQQVFRPLKNVFNITSTDSGLMHSIYRVMFTAMNGTPSKMMRAV